jgi:hypothetical protein
MVACGKLRSLSQITRLGCRMYKWECSVLSQHFSVSSCLAKSFRMGGAELVDSMHEVILLADEDWAAITICIIFSFCSSFCSMDSTSNWSITAVECFLFFMCYSFVSWPLFIIHMSYLNINSCFFIFLNSKIHFISIIFNYLFWDYK